MLFLSRVELILLVFIAYFQTISCECRQSDRTVCDTFDDFRHFEDKERVTEVVIGSEHGPTNMTSFNFMSDLPLESCYRLKTIRVIRAVNHLQENPNMTCYIKSAIEYVYFYGNDLKPFPSHGFPALAYKKLSLVNNNIESLEPYSFQFQVIEELDLSDNLMEVVQARTFRSMVSTKIITIRNNKLTHIEPNSFEEELSSLESLHLDNNKLSYLQDEALEQVTDLKELTLSHNHFRVFPKIDDLTKLVIFDISHNAISTIKNGTFKDMDDLKLVDLSNNNIQSGVVLKWLITPGKQPDLTISLGLNRLRNLDLNSVSLQNQTLVLYGNPWNCSEWSQVRKNLGNHQSKCDLEFFADGSVPYCINYYAPFGVFIYQNPIHDDDIARFHESVRKNVKKAKCSLAPPRLHWLYPIDFKC